MPRRFSINKIQSSLAAASAQPGLVNAEQVLGLPGGKSSHWFRQLVHLDCLAPGIKAKCAGTVSGTGMEVHPRWLETEVCPDSQRGVIDSEFSDSRDRFGNLGDSLKELIKTFRLLEFRDVIEKPALAFLQRHAWYSVLMWVSLPTREQPERGPTDRLFVGAEHTAEVLKLARGSRSVVLDIVADGSLDAVHWLIC